VAMWSSSRKTNLVVPLPLPPERFLPWCDPQSRDVPDNILPESLASSPGTCQTGRPKQRASPVATSSSLPKANLVVPPPLPPEWFLDRNYTAMHTHVRWSVHLSALLITWFTWGDGLQRRYASDVAFCIIRFLLTVDNSDMN
jgi:hypothetical protein